MPSEAQKQAGNYAKGHVYAHGMRISIETPAGTDREGVGKDGTPWRNAMQHDYGYIRGTTGKDGDHVDVFLGPDYKDRTVPVHVIDQHDPDTGDFDEHKAMMGFKSAADALDAYHAHYPADWAGARAITPMHVDNFKAWALSPGARKQPLHAGGAVEVSPEVAKFAEGGSVAGALADPQFYADAVSNLGAAGNRMIAGTLGLPVDVINWGLKQVPRRKSLRELIVPSQLEGYGTAEPVGGSDWIRRKLNSAGARTESGNPQADAWADAAAGLLSANPTATVRAVGSVGRRAGAGAADVLRSAAAERPAYVPKAQEGAIKTKGGNWVEHRLQDFLADRSQRSSAPTKQWTDKQLQTYIKTHLGTADDPLLALEKQGRLHTTQDELVEAAGQGLGVQGRGEYQVDGLTRFPLRTDAAPGPNSPTQFHKTATGRDYRTPWENVADGFVYSDSKRNTIQDITENYDFEGNPAASIQEMIGNLKDEGYPEGELASLNKMFGWIDKQPEDARLHSLTQAGEDPLRFGHILDYLDTAAEAGQLHTSAGGNIAHLERIAAEAPGSRTAELLPLIQRGLHMSPEQISKTSVADAAAKTSEWNKLLASKKELVERNKGIKSVLKQYDDGHQWVDVAPDGLGAEGRAMSHCVGGYCGEVERGSTRILSLRDAGGQPKVTVEVRPGTPAPEGSVPFDQLPPALREDMTARGLAPGLNEQGSLFGPDGKRYLAAPPAIRQIKGPANRAPSKEVLGMVQDLVKGNVHPELGNWGDVGDLTNTGLVRMRGGKTNIRSDRGAWKDVPVPEGYYTPSELRQHFMDQGVPDWEAASHAGDVDYLMGSGAPDHYAAGGHVKRFEDGGSSDGGDSSPSESSPSLSFTPMAPVSFSLTNTTDSTPGLTATPGVTDSFTRGIGLDTGTTGGDTSPDSGPGFGGGFGGGTGLRASSSWAAMNPGDSLGTTGLGSGTWTGDFSNGTHYTREVTYDMLRQLQKEGYGRDDAPDHPNQTIDQALAAKKATDVIGKVGNFLIQAAAPPGVIPLAKAFGRYQQGESFGDALKGALFDIGGGLLGSKVNQAVLKAGGADFAKTLGLYNAGASVANMFGYDAPTVNPGGMVVNGLKRAVGADGPANGGYSPAPGPGGTSIPDIKTWGGDGGSGYQRGSSSSGSGITAPAPYPAPAPSGGALSTVAPPPVDNTGIGALGSHALKVFDPNFIQGRTA